MLLYQGIQRKYIFSRASAISHDGEKWKIHQLHFRLSAAFHMTVQNFRMVMQNHFSRFPCVLQPSLFCFISHNYAKLKNMLFRLLFTILPISLFLIHLYHLQFSSKSQSKPIVLLLSLCIWIIINFICFLQFDSSLLSPIYQNHILK